MCCCGKPTINGQDGYSWDGKTFGVRSPLAPEIKDTDTLLYDEPGQDSESLPSYFLRLALLCQHTRQSPDGDCLDCGS